MAAIRLSIALLIEVFLFGWDIVSAHHLQFTIQVDGPDSKDWNRSFLKYSFSRDEAFFGFDHQLTYFNQRKTHSYPRARTRNRPWIDTGGFVVGDFKGIPIIARGKELLMRWMELNASTAIFRTHEGLKPSVSAQVTDPEPLAHLARLGQIYKVLGAYRRSLVEDASRHGYPVVRHLFLHFPNGPNVIDLRYQFMMGPDFPIAPVLDKNANRVRLYVPAGEWAHSWSGIAFKSDGMWTGIAAPLGKPEVFYRSGSEAGETPGTEPRV